MGFVVFVLIGGLFVVFDLVCWFGVVCCFVICYLYGLVVYSLEFSFCLVLC